VAFRDLERAMDVVAPEELDVYFDDVIDASERIWDTLENYKEVVEGLEDSNESVLSHRTNDTLRVLTSITVIVLPLTLLASLFGMNVEFPGEGTGAMFWVIMVGMAAVLVGMVLVFRNRRWL
jgi:magnesium transporter